MFDVTDSPKAAVASGGSSGGSRTPSPSAQRGTHKAYVPSPQTPMEKFHEMSDEQLKVSPSS